MNNLTEKISKKEYFREYYKKNKKSISLKQKEYQIKNEKSISLYQGEYRMKNKASALLYNKEYYIKNKENILLRYKKWCIRNRARISLNGREYCRKNKITILLKQKEYYVNNREKVLSYHKEYYVKNKENLLLESYKYKKLKLKTNIQFKLADALRNRLYNAIKRGYKAGSAVRDLGCTIDELKIWIENKFQPGMSWDNWAYRGWHIDHKLALANFDLTSREQFLIACHYTNLQPMWWDENIRKSNKTDYYGK